jgi:hypothetical protein
MLLSDFHIHSNFSDGKHSIPEIVDFYGKRGFSAIAITDHVCETNTVLGKAAQYLERTLTQATFPIYLEILKSEKERAWREYKMLLIPGIEVTKNSFSNHRSAHVLGLGITEWVNPNAPIEEICAQIRAQNSITIAAHPVSTQKLEKQTLHLWDRREEFASQFDAWEVGTGMHFFEEVAQSRLPIIANTDLHRFSQMTGWKTVVNTHASNRKNADAILDTIRKQKNTIHFYEDSSLVGVNDQILTEHTLSTDSLLATADLY